MPDNQPSLYSLLGVAPTATLAEIKDAYRRMVMQYHPDINPNANPRICHQMMCMINEAYATLRNVETRMEYDATIQEGGLYYCRPTMHIDGEIASSSEKHNPSEDVKTSATTYDYKIYEYYNERDYDYDRQQEFIEWVRILYEYCFKTLTNYPSDTPKEDINLIDKLLSLFDNIINLEKSNNKRRYKSNRL